MPDESRIDRVYAQLMRHHPYGWALYKKITRRDMFPGSCGYFDSEGDWCGIADLNNREDLAEQGWKMPDDRIGSTQPPQSVTWGPKISGSVKSNQVGGTIGATTVVAPMEASVSVLFENEDEHGAVLTTENPVKRHTVGDEKSAVQWMVDNKSEMLRRHGDVFKRHGIWIVTKTYSTRRCAVAVMTTKLSTVEISLGVDVQGVLTLTPTSAWTRSTGSFCTEVHEDDEDGVVVFISGIYFSPRLFSMGISQARDQHKQEGKFLRADGRAGSKDGEEAVELEIEFYPQLDEHEE